MVGGLLQHQPGARPRGRDVVPQVRCVDRGPDAQRGVPGLLVGQIGEQAQETALGIWSAVNGPNLRSNIAPTRSRARLVLQKAADHSVRRVLLRKL